MSYRFDLSRFVTLLAMFIVFLLLIFLGGFGGLGGGPKIGSGVLELLIVVIALAALAASFSRAPQSKDDVDIVTETRCPSCGFVIQRKFTEGDFISRQDQPCPKDHTPTVISKIFVHDTQKK